MTAPSCPDCGRDLGPHCSSDGERQSEGCDLWYCGPCRMYGKPGVRWVPISPVQSVEGERD